MTLQNDLLYALRGLRRTPGLVAVVVLTLALGIGVNTTLFNLLNLLLLAPPTATDPDRLVRIEPGNGNQISYPNYRDMAGNRAFTAIALTGGASLNWRNGDTLQPVPGMTMSLNAFSLFGNHAWMGRTFTAEDTADPHVVVLTYEFLQRHFAGDQAVIGRTLNLNGRPFTIIGVMERGYRVAMGAMMPQMFVPIGPAVTPAFEARQRAAFAFVARLAPGVSREQAQAAFTSATQALESAWPKENEGFGRPAFIAGVYGLEALRDRQARPEFFIGLAAPFVVVGLLLLIACANVAGVMLARGATRQREIAIRLALGANRSRLVRMLLADSLLLSLCGAGGGLLLTAWLTPLIGQIRIPNAPPLPQFTLHMDPRLALYTLAIAIATTVFCGLLPARQSTHPDILPWLKQGAAQGVGRVRLRRFLVSGQVAASALLLVVCLFFLRSLLFIGKVNPGFDIDHGITAIVTPEQKNLKPERIHGMAEELTRRVATLPGVRSASFTSLLPLAGDSVGSGVEMKDRLGFNSPEIQLSNVGPGYFGTMGIPVFRGREFAAADRAGAPPVVIVNETFARLFFPNGDAPGKLVRTRTQDPGPWREIVGVVADNTHSFYGEAPKPQFFSPFLQTGGRIILQVRTAGSPALSIATVTRAIAEADRSIHVEVRTTRDATSLEFTLRRMSTVLLASMGILGLLLGMIGLYGVLSWEVSRRTAEIGIRMALGASQANVRRLVLGNSLRLTGFGAVAGIGAALLLTLPLRGFLVGVNTADPLTIGTVAALLALVSVAASWFPVRRATRIDPIVALRYD